MDLPRAPSARAWARILLAAVYDVLDQQDQAKPRKQQCTTDLVVPELLDGMEEARAARATLALTSDALVAWGLLLMPTPEAVACLEAAARSCQLASAAAPGAQCCLCGAPAGNMRMFGNRGGRTESTHAVSAGPCTKWLQAAAVLGSAQEWIEQVCASYVTLHALQPPLTREAVEAMQADAKMAGLLDVYKAARTLFLRTFEQPA